MITSDKEKDAATLVTVTHDHLDKVTPALANAILVVSERPQEPLQRTKFDAVKYQWATKLRLLLIALEDIIGAHFEFPDFGNGREVPGKIAEIEELVNSTSSIWGQVEGTQHGELSSKYRDALSELVSEMRSADTLSWSDYTLLRTRAQFGVYLVHCTVLACCQDITCQIPDISPDLANDSSVEFDPVRVSAAADQAADKVTF